MKADLWAIYQKLQCVNLLGNGKVTKSSAHSSANVNRFLGRTPALTLS